MSLYRAVYQETVTVACIVLFYLVIVS